MPVVDLLNHLLADLTVGARQIHMLHWNIKDENFLDWHSYLNELYHLFNWSIDTYAEQIRFQGAYPDASLARSIELSCIADECICETVSKETAVMKAIEITMLIKLAAEKVLLAASTPELAGLNDALTGFLGELDKTLYFLKNSMTKSVNPPRHEAFMKGKKTITPSEPVCKFFDEEQLVFGWASIAKNSDGSRPFEWQDDIIDAEDLEPAVYDYMLKSRVGNEMHMPDTDCSEVIESVILTKEKMAAMGIPEGTVPEGWWIGYKIHDREVYQKAKQGIYKMFSIEGAAVREPVE